MTGRRVHVRSIEGRLQYNRLLDDGSNVIRFAKGHGFVTRDDMKRSRCSIVDGWPDADRSTAAAVRYLRRWYDQRYDGPETTIPDAVRRAHAVVAAAIDAMDPFDPWVGDFVRLARVERVRGEWGGTFYLVPDGAS